MENCQYLIILHGWQSSKEKWSRVKEIIEKEGIGVIVPDLPGFKKENELERVWDLDDYVVWLKDFSKDKEKFFLLGHSFGGRVSLLFALKHPDKLKGLILVDSAGVASKDLKKKYISNFTPALRKFSFLPGYSFIRKIFYKFIIKRTDYLYIDGAMKETFKKVIEEDLAPILSQIETKTLILWGEKDKTTPFSHAKLMKEKIKDSKIETFKGIGHNPHLDNPEALAKKILDFIK